jgi:hypothetical protein
LLWILCSLALYNDILWDCSSQFSVATEEDNWAGWILKYLSTNIIKNISSRHFRRYFEHKTQVTLMWCVDPNINDDIVMDGHWLNQNYVQFFFPWDSLYVLLSPINDIVIFPL